MADDWGTNDIPADDPWNHPKGGDPEGGNGDDRACFNCGQPGHNKADCPEPSKPFDGTCRACGQEGHTRRSCPDAPAMTCHICGEEGHMRNDCPQKPADVCRNCLEEGHGTVDCKAPRKIDRSIIPDVDADKAWEEINEAIQERDGVEAKDAIQKYLKHFPEMTYVELEKAFRSQEMDIYLIATERVLAPTHTNMDLQGNLEKKYTVQYRFSAQPDRQRRLALLPEENMSRLADAGEPVSRLMQKCTNCSELGHVAKSCPRRPWRRSVSPSPATTVVKRAIASEISGHKVSECPEPRKAGDDVECNKCHEMGHFSRDCPQGGGGGGRACHNCGDEGHISRECPEPRKIKCRNCDAEGHLSKDCDKPVDVTRIKCNNCGEMGHKSYRCPNPPKEDVDDFGPSHSASKEPDTGGGWGTGGGGSVQDAGNDGW
ncbi:LOW QUALITY PROTEIN: zinc knuckle transcription factor [Colletotrichum tofieldiae]|nr:LOW QUALITY PROTEIN: zinc knuckle transcription factor [Colletotrichum tofieldiae]